MKEQIKKFDMDSIQEGPLESGKLSAMDLTDILDKYLDSRNRTLTIVRIYARKTIEDVAKELGIKASELKAIENGEARVPFQLVPKFSKIFKVDLKMLLTMLGHTKVPEITKPDESYQLGLAAQYSGPELTKQEKIDIEKLFKMIVEQSKNKSSKGRR